MAKQNLAEELIFDQGNWDTAVYEPANAYDGSSIGLGLNEQGRKIFREGIRRAIARLGLELYQPSAIEQ